MLHCHAYMLAGAFAFSQRCHSITGLATLTHIILSLTRTQIGIIALCGSKPFSIYPISYGPGSHIAVDYHKLAYSLACPHSDDHSGPRYACIFVASLLDNEPSTASERTCWTRAPGLERWCVC